MVVPPESKCKVVVGGRIDEDESKKARGRDSLDTEDFVPEVVVIVFKMPPKFGRHLSDIGS